MRPARVDIRQLNPDVNSGSTASSLAPHASRRREEDHHVTPQTVKIGSFAGYECMRASLTPPGRSQLLEDVHTIPKKGAGSLGYLDLLHIHTEAPC